MMTRIAIYARKSVESDKGDSINIQIAKCRDYMKATTPSGEEIEFIEYKDEGYTGANTFRPGFQRLMRAIEQNKIDVLICYKLDRITRSVADFSEIDKKLQKHKVNFVSVNERFDTTNSTGRAMLRIVIVFAQLERETIAERVTDNMFALAKTERWISGKAPLGYKLCRFEVSGTKKKQTRLEIDEATAPHIQIIFNKYRELRSMSKLETYLLQNHIKSQNGKDMTTSQIALILKNPSYVKADERVKEFYISQGAQFYGDIDGQCGLMTYAKTKSLTTDEGKQGLERKSIEQWIISVGTHPGMIEPDVWLEAQRLMAENHDKFPRIQKSNTALLSGIIRCAECGSPMLVTYARITPAGEKGYYYVCSMRKKSKNTRCTNKNVRADMVEQAIINEIKRKGINKEKFLADLREDVKNGKQELAHDPIALIKDDIKKKETQVARLVNRVSQTDNEDLAMDYESQIRRLKKEIVELHSEVSSWGTKKTKVSQTGTYIENMENLLDKCDIIDNLDLEDQRELVKVLFKRIEWDSKTGKLKLETTISSTHGDDGSDDDNGGGGGSSDGDGGLGDYDDRNYTSLESLILGVENSHYHTSLSQVVRHYHEAFISYSKAFAFHNRGNHLKSLACSYCVS